MKSLKLFFDRVNYIVAYPVLLAIDILIQTFCPGIGNFTLAQSRANVEWLIGKWPSSEWRYCYESYDYTDTRTVEDLQESLREYEASEWKKTLEVFGGVEGLEKWLGEQFGRRLPGYREIVHNNSTYPVTVSEDLGVITIRSQEFESFIGAGSSIAQAEYDFKLHAAPKIDLLRVAVGVIDGVERYNDDVREFAGGYFK